MDHRDLESWEAQEPPRGFADAVVAAAPVSARTRFIAALALAYARTSREGSWAR